MSTNSSISSRIARHQLAIAVVLAGLLTNTADLWITLQARVLESNPIVLALGWETWTAVKAGALLAFVGAAWVGREHRFGRVAAAGPLAVGLFGLVGNAATMGWHATPLGRRAVVAIGASTLVVGLGVVGAGRLRRLVGRGVGQARPAARRAAPAAMAVLMVTSMFAGVVVLGTQPLADGQSGTASAAAGDEIWSFDTGDTIIDNSPTIANGSAFIGSDDNSVYSVDVETGSKEWEFATGSSVSSSPEYHNGSVFVGSNDHNLYKLDAENGTEQWSFTASESVTTSPAYAAGLVIVMDNTGTVYAVDAETGTEEWNKSIEISNFITPTSPTATNGSVFVGGVNGLFSLDVETGDQEWNYATGSNIEDSSATVQNGTVYVGDTGGVLYAVDSSAGTLNWEFSTGDPILSSPTVSNGSVFVGSEDNSVYSVDAQNGDKEWSTSLGDLIQSSPTVAGGRVYIGSYANALHVLDADNGAEEWKTSFGADTAYQSPTVADGVVFMPVNSSLYAFDTSHSDSSSGSRVRLGTLGDLGSSYLPSAGGSTTADINGTVVNQQGQPIGDTTVKAFAYINATDPATGLDELAELSNPLPDAFANQTNTDFQLLGDSGTLTDTDRPYALIYEESKFAAQGIREDPPDLSNPKWRQIEHGETVAIAVGDPTATGFFYQDDFDRQVPGSLIGEGEQASVVVQEVLPSGENGTARVEKTVQLTDENDGWLDATRQRYATLDTSTLTPGFYRITPKVDGEAGYSYLIRIGSPYELINRYTETAEGRSSYLAEQAQEAINQDRMVVKTTVTNESGAFSIDVPDNTQAVQIQAYRTNGETDNLANITLEDLETIDGSLYFPTQPKRVTPPASDIQLRMTEVSAAPGANVTELREEIEYWQERAQNDRQTFGDTPETVEDVAEKSVARLLDIRDRLAGIVSENEQAEEYYCQNYPGCEGNTTAFEETDNKTRLNQQITGLGEALEYAAQNTDSVTEDEELEDTPTEVFDLIELPYAPESVEELTATATFDDGSTETIDEDALVLNNDTLVVNDWAVPEDKTLEDVTVDYPEQNVTDSDPDPIEDRGETLSGKWEFDTDLTQYDHIVGVVEYESAEADLITNYSEHVTISPNDTITVDGLPLKDDAEFVEVDRWSPFGETFTLDATRVDEPETPEETANLLNTTWDVGFDTPSVDDFEVYAEFEDGTESRIPTEYLSTSGQNVTVSEWPSPHNKEFDGVRFDWPSDTNSGNDTEVDVPENDVTAGLDRGYQVPYNLTEPEQVVVNVGYDDGTRVAIPHAELKLTPAPDGDGTVINIEGWPTNQSNNVTSIDLNVVDVSESTVNISKKRFYSATIQFGDLLSGTDVAERTDVSVIVRYQDGSVQQMNESYWSLNKRIGRSDQVVIEDFPIPESKSVATVNMYANTEDGLSKLSNEVEVTDNALQLESIAFSDRSPGSQSPVSVTVSPSGTAELVDVDVIGPDNAELNHTQTGRTATFTTAGPGVHEVQFTFETEGGTTTVTRSIQAFQNPPVRSPAVRESGDVAIADGLKNAEISSSAGGRVRTMLAVLEDGQETPSKVRYYGDAGDTKSTTYRLGMVQGDQRQAVSGHQAVVLHLPPLPEDALVYRVTDEGSEPITANASIGSISHSANKTVIETYTTTDGDVGVEVVYDPGILERVDWWGSTSVPDIGVPSFGFGMVSSPLLSGALLVLARRRRNLR